MQPIRSSLPEWKMRLIAIDKLCREIDHNPDGWEHLNTQQKRRERFGYYSPLELKYNHIEVRKSPIHGIGVFATQSIPEGSLVTYYPAHAFVSGKQVTFLDASDRQFIKNKEKIIPDYGYSFTWKDKIVGSPYRVDDALLLGHMLNDAYINIFRGVKKTHLKRLENLKNLIATYTINGHKRANCIYKENKDHSLVSVATTRKIEKGEELLVLYHTSYWMNFEYGGSDDIMREAHFKNPDFAAWFSELNSWWYED